jgi:preprotein translocase subunit SecD
MLQVARWRIILVAAVTILGLLFAAPNFIPASIRDSMPGFLPKQAINLGLDLRGGSQILLEVEIDELRKQQLENVVDQMAAALREAEPRIPSTGRGVVGDAARLRLTDVADLERAQRALAPLARIQTSAEPILTFAESADGVIEARIPETRMNQVSRDAAQQSIEVIRRRIDPNGTSEVSITRQGDRRIVVQAPGVADPQQLKELIGQTALLTFHMVATANTAGATMTVPPYPEINQYGPETVERRARLSGEHMLNAAPSTDGQTGEWVMSFRLNNQGARIFCRITQDNTGERFAILLDNQVLTAPVINEPICGGSGQISGSFTAKSADNLARMINAGALPAPLTVIDERTVDASLGRDAIESGTSASIVAGLVTVVFMLLAYGTFGVFACVALIINGVLIMAAMSLIGAALTLPGIAGLILTIAMAVDANVLIYERMREEAGLGRGPALAIDAGFNRAMITIVDANLTTILAAGILFGFGAGPVKGFAWTLSIGVITSVFTAVLVTQILVAWWFRLSRPKTLPI